MKPLTLHSDSQEETVRIGHRLGRLLAARKAGGTVCLYGELGAGKTTFIKGFASAFGIPERDIGSASFVIVAAYETIPPFYHIDLYRLEGAEALDEAGIWEYIGTGGVAVIEWAERLDMVPEDALSVRLKYLENGSRQLIVEGINETDRHNL